MVITAILHMNEITSLTNMISNNNLTPGVKTVPSIEDIQASASSSPSHSEYSSTANKSPIRSAAVDHHNNIHSSSNYSIPSTSNSTFHTTSNSKTNKSSTVSYVALDKLRVESVICFGQHAEFLKSLGIIF